ncbi:MAG: 7-carboxy-7-deazaguanine synthase QueE [Rhodothermus sp.]|nr:7-carboxy-7-deazaguanine synthase QueE [Rhodothermus sp.]
MRTYRVKAIWKTLQGEGFFAGRPAVFARFVGCNLWSGLEQDRARDAQRTGADCPRWCDTDFRKEGSHAYTADELVAALQEVGGPIRFCVLTGGEPLLQLDATLMKALKAADYFVAIETNGTISLRRACTDPETGQLMAPDWIVCSPKLPEDRLALEYFDELKLVVPDYRPEQYARFARRARPHRVSGHRIPLLWLQPEDGPRLEAAQRCAVELALTHPEWRVSVQTHKVLGVP